MAFDSELEAFRAYLRVFPETTILLIDTYDTLAGAETATRLGPVVKGVRLDSGDLGELSKQVRAILDAAAMRETKIVASGDLDEYKIEGLLGRGAPIDLFGVGTQLSTSYDAPTLGGVYKLVEEVVDGKTIHKMKLSTDKSHYPGCKQVWRQVDDNGNFCRDIIGLAEEEAPPDSFPLMTKVMEQGRVVVPYPKLDEIRRRTLENLPRLPGRFRRLRGADQYPVVISSALEGLKEQVISELILQNGLTPLVR
jgi:nicotinate phosphoribosyltransferase